MTKLEGRAMNIESMMIPPNLMHEKQRAFVALRVDEKLHGYIDHILPVKSLYRDVIENAQVAAFSDPRFEPLSRDEFKRAKIEISILTHPKKFDYILPYELTEFLEKEKPGVIISKDRNSATFLPQVWEELPEPEDFLAHLCLKAGLQADRWAKGDLKIEIYQVEKIS